jgi:WD40 repeat protein
LLFMNLKEADVIYNGKVNRTEWGNPFPGLKPFDFDESHLFFGREGQADEILDKLFKNRFVGVVGTSGSGKSSLISCGLLPLLFGGYFTKAGSGWKVFASRPGMMPIENLAEALFLEDRNKETLTEEELQAGKNIITSILKSSSLGLVDILKKHIKSNQKNILLVIDQFEEIFRLIDRESRPEMVNDVNGFVNLLLKSIQQQEVSVYIVIGMRSDYLGETAQFPDLTRIINDSHFLIPQMTRDQLQLAIEGPIAVGGGNISKRLVQQLLNDVGNSSNKLPVMQHALMRTWEFWVKNQDQDEPLDIRHYSAIGRLEESLSLHADETYNELTTREKEICETVFKSLTEKGREIYGVRRPCSLSEIVLIAEVSEQELVNVIEMFRQPGRSLLMPPPGIPLTSNTIIEISHESLMWIWNRLKVWVNEEAESAQMYLRLSEAAKMYQIGRTGLWRPPDLQLALNWQQKQKPSFIWAQRYEPYYERAIVFLETSKKAFEDEQKSLAMFQRRSLQKAKITSLFLGTAAIISIIFFIFAIVKKIEADNQASIAVNNAIVAQSNFELAENRLKEVDQQRRQAEEAREQATRYAFEAQINFEQAKENAEQARINQELAEEHAALAENQANIARRNEEEAHVQKGFAEQNEKKAFRLRMLSIAQSMAVKSLQERGNDLKGLLALQAYNFNLTHGGEKYDGYIYDGLYFALRQLKNDSVFYKLEAHSDAVRSIVFNGEKVFSTGSDGRILTWGLKNYNNHYNLVYTNNYINRVVKVSADGRWLINAGEMPFIQLFDLKALNPRPIRIEAHNGIIYDMEFLSDRGLFVSTGSDSAIWINDYSSSRLFKKIETQIKTLSVSPDGRYLAGGSVNGKAYIWNTTDFANPVVIDVKSPIHKVLFNFAGNKLAIGDENGNITLFDFAENMINEDEKTVLTGHHSRINDIRFSKDDFFLASAGFDGRIQLWNMNNLDKLPIVFRDHQSYVWSLAFSPDGNHIVAGSKSGSIKIWPTQLEELAAQICAQLTRNMARKEWERYVAPDIEYGFTCPGIVVKQN